MGLVKDLRKQSDELGVPIWKLPDVVLVLMALVNICVMILTYFWATKSDNDPGKVILLVAIEAAVIMIIGNVLSESAKSIVETNKLKKEFIQIISHQMRSPLTTMKWQLELLKKKGTKNLTEKQIEQLDRIYEENERLTNMIADILNMSRIEKNLEHLIYSKIVLEESVQDCINMLSGFARFKRVEIDFKRNKKGHDAFVDNEKLKIAIVNVIENAISYSKTGGKVTLTIKDSNGMVDLKIKDRGIGIKKGEQEVVFNKFYRGEGGKKAQPEGTGLGLFMSKKVIEQMKGKIILKSTEGKGSEFCLRLPTSKK